MSPSSSSLDIDFDSALNPEQLAAVKASAGPALVLAGAGSGKTRTLTYRVAYLLSQGVPPWKILLLTFTNKAANEMLGRVEELTGQSKSQFWGGTFHHIGQKMLRMHGSKIGIEPNYSIMDAGDADALLADAIKETQAQFLKDKSNPKARVVGDVLSYAVNTRESIGEVVAKKYPFFEHLVEEFEAFAKAYELKKREACLVDYDDLLVLWLKLLEEVPQVAQIESQRFEHILVDEYQDTNVLQAAIIDRLAPHHQIMAVGDDAQCIYTWRGADIDNILTFPDRHPETTVYKIQTNYRSTPQILDFANGILPSTPGHELFEKKLTSPLAQGAKPYYSSHVDTKRQAQFVISRIHGLVNEGYQRNEIAVLYRAHYQALDLQMELARHNISFEITSGVRFFEQAHIRDLVAQLRFLGNPSDHIAFTRFASLLPKVGPKTAERLLKLAKKEALFGGLCKALSSESVLNKVPEAAKETWTDMAYSLEDVASSLEEGKPADFVQTLIEGWYSDFLPNIYPNWQSRQDDLASLVEFAGRFDNLDDLLAQLALLNSELTDPSAEPFSGESIQLSTIHQAKGLEFPVVFIIGLSQNLFPLKRAIEDGDIDEERRLFYVAATRAQRELHLCSPKMLAQGGPPMLMRPSVFLEEQPENTYEQLFC